MNTRLILCLALLASPAASVVADDSESDHKRLNFNVSILKPSGDQVKRSIMRSMMNHNWVVDKVGDDFVEGNIEDRRVRVDFDTAHNLRITGMNGAKDKWLKILQKDIWVELALCGGI